MRNTLKILGPACTKCGQPMTKSDAPDEAWVVFDCVCGHTFKQRRKTYQRPSRSQPFHHGPDSAA